MCLSSLQLKDKLQVQQRAEYTKTLLTADTSRSYGRRGVSHSGYLPKQSVLKSYGHQDIVCSSVAILLLPKAELEEQLEASWPFSSQVVLV